MRLLDGIFARGAAAQAASEHAFFQALGPPSRDTIAALILEATA